MALKVYADHTPRMARQIAADVGFLLWSAFWIWVATRLYSLLMPLASPGRQLEAAGEALSGNVEPAEDFFRDLPFLGDTAAAPFERIGEAGDSLAAAGELQQTVVGRVALFMSVMIAVLAISVVMVIWLPLRVRFIRRATTAQQFVDDVADIDLFALRAMARQPLHRLTRIDPDPAGAWRRGDQRVINALADLELRDEGISMPPLPAPVTRYDSLEPPQR
jgi:hypothetical protein